MANIEKKLPVSDASPTTSFTIPADSGVDLSSLPPDLIPQYLLPDAVKRPEVRLSSQQPAKESLKAKLIVELGRQLEREEAELNEEDEDEGDETEQDEEEADEDDDGNEAEVPDAITEDDLNNIDSMTPDELEGLIDHVALHEDWQELRDRARERVSGWLKGVRNADAAPRCEFLKHNGARCGSPAVKGEAMCYHHGEARTKRLNEEAANILLAPVLEDRASIQVALTRLLSLLASNAVDEKSARVMISALRLAHRNLGESRSIYD